MWKHIKVDGTNLVCYTDGTIIRQHIINKKWIKVVSKSKKYWKICIRNNKKRKFYSIHRIIANAFLGLNLNSELVVDHKNHDIHNNSVANLQVVTQQQNTFNTNAKGYSKRSYIKKDGTEVITWEIHLKINGKDIKKCVATEEEARLGYLELKRIHHII